jgi:hypothetical protein
MDVFKIAAKLFVVGDPIAHDQFIPIFHHWIQAQSVEGHLLIDVADYAHVVAGPGTVLISSQANFHMDRGENRLGLSYWRKLPLAGPFPDRLRAVLSELFKAAEKLQAEPELQGRLTFATNELLIRLNDRLLAPNNMQTMAAVRPAVEALMRQIYGGSAVTVESNPQPQALFELRIKSSQSPPLMEMLDRLGAAPAPSR